MAQDIQAAEMPETSFYVLITRTGISWSASAVQSVVSNAYQVYPSMPAGFALVKASIVSIGIDFIDVMVAVKNGDAEEIPKAATEAIASITVGALAAIAMGIYGAPIAATIIFGGILSGIGKYLGGLFWENYKKQVDASLAIVPTEEILWGEFEFDFWRIPGGIQPGIRNQCNRYTLDALNWTPPPPPLWCSTSTAVVSAASTLVQCVMATTLCLKTSRLLHNSLAGAGWVGIPTLADALPHRDLSCGRYCTNAVVGAATYMAMSNGVGTGIRNQPAAL